MNESAPTTAALDRVGTASLDRYARMVRRALGVPVALVSMVEPDRQVFPGAVGLPERYQTERQTPLSHSFCQHVVADARPLVIADARRDDRVRDNLAIPDLGVVAYAGWPLVDIDGRTVGSVCAIHDVPHAWTDDELAALEDIAQACSAELVQRQLHERAAAQAELAVAVTSISQMLLALSEHLARTRTIEDVSAVIERVAHEQLDCLHAGVWLRDGLGPGVTAPRTAPSSTGRVETMTFVAHDGSTWSQAERHARLPVSPENPLGTALLSDGLVVLDDHAHLAAAYPHLAGPERVGETRAYVPLSLADETYGAVALVWDERRHLTEDDRTAIMALRSYTAQAVQRALLLQARVDVAITLQQAMLTRLPQPDHLQLTARYLPAASGEQVGGDWYDAVVMPDGATHLVVGDVVGHDMGAAAVMGQVRGILRAFAWTHTGDDDTPARLVERLDRALVGLGVDTLATLVHARVDRAAPPDGESFTLRWTNAGHPSPLVMTPDGTVEALEDMSASTRRDCLLGVDPGRDRTEHVRVLPAGSTLLMFTDGLVERRHETIDDGWERAAQVLRGLAGLPLDETLDRLIEGLVGTAPDDDVVVLGVRFGPAAPEQRAPSVVE